MTGKMIVFQPMGRRVEADGGLSLLDLANRNGVEIEAACGGKGQCGKCRVQVQGDASTPEMLERVKLGDAIRDGYRLACQTSVNGAASVWVPEASQRLRQVILTDGRRSAVTVDPCVRLFEVTVAPAVLFMSVADRERLLCHLSYPEGISSDDFWKTPLAVLRGLETKLKQDSGRVSVAVASDGTLLDIQPGWGHRQLGLAVDLGTTTIVVYLMDLADGQPLAVRADMNPQVSVGEDVISRISYCQERIDGLDRLTDLVRHCIDKLTHEACQEIGVDPKRILDSVVVGNTAMHHIFLGLNPASLAAAPYAPVASDSLDVPATSLGLGFAPQARIHLLPVKAGFVGADTVAVALALDADRVTEPTLMVDLGTNGEIILATADEILCCSTAAGPAFEGGQIRWGMRGATGAVDRVVVSEADLRPELSVIGGGPPLGICGSGLVSLVSGLIRIGIVTPAGGFNPDRIGTCLRHGDEGLEYVLADARHTLTGADLVLTHRDLSQLQLAKAAIQAGISLMLAELGVTHPSRVRLAGAFGNYLDPGSACGIGLFPGVDKSRVEGVGNAAGAGAVMALINRHERKRARSLARRMRYIELAAHPGFKDAYLDAMYFPGGQQPNSQIAAPV